MMNECLIEIAQTEFATPILSSQGLAGRHSPMLPSQQSFDFATVSLRF